jgi:hypothetical protein
MTARWKNRRTVADDSPSGQAVPIVRVVEGQEIPGVELVATLKEMNSRQWGAMLQLLIEAKYKAESMLRDPAVIANPSQLAYYSGWAVYADFVISSFEQLRAGDAGNRPDEEI